MDHDHQLKGLNEIKNITEKRKKLQIFFWGIWYGGKVDRRNEGIGIGLRFFFC